MADPIEYKIESSSELNRPGLPKFYTNWLIGGHSLVDIYLLSYMNGVPNFVINMPLGTAKHLHGLLGEVIEGFEKKIKLKLKLKLKTFCKMKLKDNKYKEFIKEIESFQHLLVGWDFHHANPIGQQVIDKAKDIFFLVTILSIVSNQRQCRMVE